MAYQNINQYNYPKLKLQVIYDGQDMSIASDEVDYNQEVVFSPFIFCTNPLSTPVKPISQEVLELKQLKFKFSG